MALAGTLLSCSSFGAEFFGHGQRLDLCPHGPLVSTSTSILGGLKFSASIPKYPRSEEHGFDTNHAGVLPRAVFWGEKGQRRSLTPPRNNVCGQREVAEDLLEKSGLQTLPGFHLNRGLEMRVWLGNRTRSLVLGLRPCGNCLLCCFGLSSVEDGLLVPRQPEHRKSPCTNRPDSGQAAAKQLKAFASERLN